VNVVSKRPKGLGRGLDALLGDETTAPPSGEPLAVPIAQLRPGKFQPRTRMNPESLAELAESIKVQGVMQPILVRSIGAEMFEIIAGERRYRAAQLAGLSDVPVLVRNVPDSAALAMALIENIQREDLNPLEEAQGVARLIREFSFTHEQAARAIGRSRSATSNLLRLLNLAPPVQELVMSGRLDMGHGRALLSVDAAKQIELGQRIARRQLSVRASEALVAKAQRERLEPRAKMRSRDTERLENDLADLLGTSVRIAASGKGAGQLTIRFSSLDQLDGIVAKLRN
jgi:ParB family chromosome partitioning protein